MELKAKDWFTLATCASGIAAIALTLWAYSYAWVFLLASFLFDYLDGKTARGKKEKNDFGKHLDSLADMCSFGVAPVFLVATIASSYITLATGIIYACAACLRLAKFTVQADERVFYGLPTPAAAAIVIVTYLVTPGLASIVLLLCAGAMVANYKWEKPSF